MWREYLFPWVLDCKICNKDISSRQEQVLISGSATQNLKYTFQLLKNEKNCYYRR